MCMADLADEFYTLARSMMRTARKAHKCFECNRTIEPGEQYEYMTGLYHDHWDTFRTCAHCLAGRVFIERECHGWLYGAVLDDIIEHWEENNLLRSWSLAKLTWLARNRWRGRSGDLVDPDGIRRLAVKAAS